MSPSKNQPFVSAMMPYLLTPTLVKMVHARYWWFRGREQIEDAVMAAIEHLLEQDEHILRGTDKEIEESVLRSLYATACRMVGDGFRAAHRRCAREREYARRKDFSASVDFFVANELSAANIAIEGKLMLENLMKDFSPREREFVELRLQRYIKLTDYAKLLDMEAYPVTEQRRVVKQMWDRLLKRLQRRAKKLLEGSWL